MIKFLSLVMLISFPTVSAPLITNVFRESDFFVGREQEISSINESLNKKRICAVVGFSGMGKTLVTKEYIIRNQQNYDLIWWIDAEHSVTDQMVEFAKACVHSVNNPDILRISASGKATLLLLKNFLLHTSLRWIIIFDNVAHFESIKDYVPFGSASGSVLITSKNRGVWSNNVSIEPFSERDSKKFFRDSSINDDGISQLLKELRGYPIALSQASSYLGKHPSVSPKMYIKTLRDRKEYMKFKTQNRNQKNNEKEISALQSEWESIHATIDITFKELSVQNKLIRHLLGFVFFMETREIPRDFFYIYADFFQIPRKFMDQMLLKLKENSTLKSKKIEGKVYYETHEIFKSFIEHEFTQKELKKHLLWAIDVFAYMVDKPDSSINALCPPKFFVQHLASLIENALANSCHSKSVFKCLLWYIEYLVYAKRNHKKAIKNIEFADYLINKTTRIPKHLLARYQAIRGDVLALHHANNPLIMQDILRKMLEAATHTKEIVSANREDTLLELWNSILQYYLILGDTESAHMALKNAEKYLIDCRSDYLREKFYYFKAWYLTCINDFMSALESINKSMNIVNKHQDTPLTFYVFNLRAFIYFSLERYQECLNDAQRSIDKCTSYFLKEKNDTIAEAYAMAAAGYLGLKRYQKALNYSSKSIKMYDLHYHNERTLEDHAFVFIIHANALSALSKSSMALKSYGAAQEILDGLSLKKNSNIYELFLFSISNHAIRNKKFPIFQKYFSQYMGAFGFEGKKLLSLMEQAYRAFGKEITSLF